MARRRASVRGNFNSILRRLPVTVEEEFRAELHKTGEKVLNRAKRLVSRKSGALASGLKMKVAPKRLNLKVGLITRADQRKLFYGRFVEFGHRIAAPGKRLERFPKVAGRYGSTTYRLGMMKRLKSSKSGGYVRPRPFLYTFSRDELYAPFQKIWGRALFKAIQGSTTESIAA